MLSTFGEQAFAFIVDEGGMFFFSHLVPARQFNNTVPVGGFEQSFGSVVALPGVVEKGYIDVRLSVASPGGHSSIPPKHTVGTLVSCPWPISDIPPRASVFWLRSSPRSRPTPSLQSYPEVSHF